MCQVVLKSFKSSLYVCPSGSPCPCSYISVWLRNKPAFMLERRGESAGSTQPTVSNRADIQYQSTCTVSGTTHSYLLSSPSLPHTFSVSLLFAHQTASAIYVSFLKPLMPQAAVAVMDLSLCISRKTQADTRAAQHANTQMFSFRQMWYVVLIRKNM